MQLHELRPNNQNKKKKPRVGRGGKRGTYSGKGVKGQKSRAGRRIRPAERDFIQRLPKLRGHKNMPKRPPARAINLKDLEKFSGEIVNPKSLYKFKFIKKPKGRVKILSKGEVKRALIIQGLEISKSAREKIEKAGGKVVSEDKTKK